LLEAADSALFQVQSICVKSNVFYRVRLALKNRLCDSNFVLKNPATTFDHFSASTKSAAQR
jgi:hypothetical protein